MLCQLCGSSFWLVGMYTVPGSVWMLLLLVVVGISVDFCSFLLYWQWLVECSRGMLCRCLKIHVSNYLFSGTLIWWTSALVSSLLAMHWVFNARQLLGSSWMSLPGIQPVNSPRGLSWNNYRVHHINFLFFKDHCSLLPEIQYLVNGGFMYLVCILFISPAPCLLHVEWTFVVFFRFWRWSFFMRVSS